jgi:hypothetical protein
MPQAQHGFKDIYSGERFWSEATELKAAAERLDARRVILRPVQTATAVWSVATGVKDGNLFTQCG